MALYIDKDGISVWPDDYERAEEFSEGLAVVKKDGYYGFINTYGNIVIPCVYDDAEPFSEGLASVLKGEMSLFIHPDGEEAFKLPYMNNVGSFHDGLASVCSDWSDLYGYVDKNGEIVIDCVYESVEDFCDGIAEVELRGKDYYIDTNGHRMLANQ